MEEVNKERRHLDTIYKLIRYLMVAMGIKEGHLIEAEMEMRAKGQSEWASKRKNFNLM